MKKVVDVCKRLVYHYKSRREHKRHNKDYISNHRTLKTNTTIIIDLLVVIND